MGMVKWIVNQGGFSPGAIKALEEHNIYYSAASEINELLHLFGIQRLLPEKKKTKAGTPARGQEPEKGKQRQAKAGGLMSHKEPPSL